MISENIEFRTLPRDEFERLPYYPPNYIFLVMDNRVTSQGVVRSVTLYKGDIPVTFEDVLSLVPDNIQMDNGGFRGMAFRVSEEQPEPPKETDFPFYKDLVNSQGEWKSRPDRQPDYTKDEAMWLSMHWFNGDEANTLDSGDRWTLPLQVSGRKMTIDELSEEDVEKLQKPARDAIDAANEAADAANEAADAANEAADAANRTVGHVLIGYIDEETGDEAKLEESVLSILKKDPASHVIMFKKAQEGEYCYFPASVSVDGAKIQITFIDDSSGDASAVTLSYDASTGDFLDRKEQDSSISSEITVNLGPDGKVGGLKTGDVISKGTNLEQFIKKLTQVKVATTMTQPSISLSISPSGNNHECGEVADIVCTPTFKRGGKGSGSSVDDTYGAGAVTAFKIMRNGSIIKTGTAVEGCTDSGQTIPDGSITYAAQVTYEDGQVPTDNLGSPDPSAQIKGGIKTATASVTGRRKVFWQDGSAAIAHASSADIRALAKSQLGSLPSTITTGASQFVVIAYPASLGDITIKQGNASDADITGQFVKTTVQVEGANGYAAAEYNVYSLSAASPFANGTPLKISF